MNRLNPNTAHRELLRCAIRGRLTEDDALLWMVLLHTHQVQLVPDAVDDKWRKHEQRGVVVLAPHTQRGVADVIASLWAEYKQKRNRDPDERTNYVYWYWQYNTRVPYELAESIPDELRPRVEELRDLLAHDDRVVAVVPED